MQKVPKNTCSIYYNVVMYTFQWSEYCNMFYSSRFCERCKNAAQIRIELSTEHCGCSVSVVLLQLMFHTLQTIDVWHFKPFVFRSFSNSMDLNYSPSLSC